MNKHKQPLLIPQGVTVEESRRIRLQQQQARFRNRGGTFVPSERNKVLELLMARSITGESPTKSKRPRASVGRSTLKRGCRKSLIGTSSTLSAKKSKKAPETPKDKDEVKEDVDQPDTNEEPAPTKTKKKGKAKAKPKAKPKAIKPRTPAKTKKVESPEKPSPQPQKKRTETVNEGKEDSDVSEEEVRPLRKPVRAVKETKKPRKQSVESANLEKTPPASELGSPALEEPAVISDIVKSKTKRSVPKRKTLESDPEEEPCGSPRFNKRKAAAPPTHTKADAALETLEETEHTAPKKRRKAANSTDQDILPIKAKARAKAKVAASKQPQSKHSKTSSSLPTEASNEAPPLKRRRQDDEPEPERKAKRRKSPCPEPPDSSSSQAPHRIRAPSQAPETKSKKKGKPALKPSRSKDEKEVERLLFMVDCDETLTIGPDALKAIKQLAKAPKSEKPVSKTSNLKENVKSRTGIAAASRSTSQKGIPDAVMARLKKLAGAQHVCDEDPDPLDCIS
jgi:hypothetical protein